jgi:proteic killer suppression protein
MIVTFEQKYLQELFETGKTSDKKHRFQTDVVEKYRKRIQALQDAGKIEELFVVNSLHYEVLKGDKAGISSIRVNKQYRIEFTVKDNGIEPWITICNILELSNHYKK